MGSDGRKRLSGAHAKDLWDGVQPGAARAVLMAALESFAARGYHATTTRDISIGAGLSPAALYVHYKSKEELLFQISRIGRTSALEVVRAAEARDLPPIEQTCRMIYDFTFWHAQNHTLARVVQYESAALDSGHRRTLAVLTRDTEAVVRRLIRRGVKAGDFEVSSERGAGLAVLSLGIDVARWYRPGGAYSPASLSALYADLGRRMLLARAS